ncbi:MAG: hypothetical protein V2I27_09335 [Erythrobacter sp.]|jgi:hypothetical protein|nr:hypothetical protein [Erythrobacter sp.]
MKRILALLSLAGFTACAPYPESSNFTSNQHDEITDIADASAFGALEDADQIREINDRLDEIEQRLDNAGL